MTGMFTTSVVGSLPRPQSLKDSFKNGQMSLIEQNKACVDRIHLQEECGIDVLTDGEQRRTSFIAFLAQRIPGFKLIHIKDIEPNYQALFTRIGSRITDWRGIAQAPLGLTNICGDELYFTKGHTKHQVKITLPSPYLVMWECWDKRYGKDFYATPEDLGFEYAKVLGYAITQLRDIGADFVQLDEPMLGDLVEASDTEPDRYRKLIEAVHGQKYRGMSEELRTAQELINSAIKGISGVRIGLHMDRWVEMGKPEFGGVGYEKLCPDLLALKVKQFVVEYSNPLTGDPSKFAAQLDSKQELGLGVVSVINREVETVEKIKSRVRTARLPPERIWLVPDCGFAPGMYRPFPEDVLRAKLTVMSKAAQELRAEYA